MQVLINPYHRSVTINGEEIIQKINPFPNTLNNLATMSCEYDEETGQVTSIKDVHRFVSHFVEREYYFTHLPEYVAWFKLEKQAQIDAAEEEERQRIELLNKYNETINACTTATETITNEKTDAVNVINSTKITTVKEVRDATTGAINEVNKIQTESVEQLEEIRTSANSEITQKRTDALSSIELAKTDGVNAITNTFNKFEDEVKTPAIQELNSYKDTFIGNITAVRNEAVDTLTHNTEQHQVAINTTAQQVTNQLNTRTEEIVLQIETVKSEQVNAATEAINTLSDEKTKAFTDLSDTSSAELETIKQDVNSLYSDIVSNADKAQNAADRAAAVADVDFATTEKAGLVRVGDTLNIDTETGKLSANIASSDNLGVVKIGKGLVIDVDGTLSLDNLALMDAPIIEGAYYFGIGENAVNTYELTGLAPKGVSVTKFEYYLNDDYDNCITVPAIDNKATIQLTETDEDKVGQTVVLHAIAYADNDTKSGLASLSLEYVLVNSDVLINTDFTWFNNDAVIFSKAFNSNKLPSAPDINTILAYKVNIANANAKHLNIKQITSYFTLQPRTGNSFNAPLDVTFEKIAEDNINIFSVFDYTNAACYNFIRGNSIQSSSITLTIEYEHGIKSVFTHNLSVSTATYLLQNNTHSFKIYKNLLRSNVGITITTASNGYQITEPVEIYDSKLNLLQAFPTMYYTYDATRTSCNLYIPYNFTENTTYYIRFDKTRTTAYSSGRCVHTLVKIVTENKLTNPSSLELLGTENASTYTISVPDGVIKAKVLLVGGGQLGALPIESEPESTTGTAGGKGGKGGGIISAEINVIPGETLIYVIGGRNRLSGGDTILMKADGTILLRASGGSWEFQEENYFNPAYVNQIISNYKETPASTTFKSCYSMRYMCENAWYYSHYGSSGSSSGPITPKFDGTAEDEYVYGALETEKTLNSEKYIVGGTGGSGKTVGGSASAYLSPRTPLSENTNVRIYAGYGGSGGYGDIGGNGGNGGSIQYINHKIEFGSSAFWTQSTDGWANVGDGGTGGNGDALGGNGGKGGNVSYVNSTANFTAAQYITKFGSVSSFDLAPKGIAVYSGQGGDGGNGVRFGGCGGNGGDAGTINNCKGSSAGTYTAAEAEQYGLSGWAGVGGGFGARGGDGGDGYIGGNGGNGGKGGNATGNTKGTSTGSFATGGENYTRQDANNWAGTGGNGGNAGIGCIAAYFDV